MISYLVIYEKDAKGWGAYLPDLPGCVAVGKTEAEVKSLIREAVEMHLQGMIEDGIPLPQPTSMADQILIAA